MRFNFSIARFFFCGCVPALVFACGPAPAHQSASAIPAEPSAICLQARTRALDLVAAGRIEAAVVKLQSIETVCSAPDNTTRVLLEPLVRELEAPEEGDSHEAARALVDAGMQHETTGDSAAAERLF